MRQHLRTQWAALVIAAVMAAAAVVLAFDTGEWDAPGGSDGKVKVDALATADYLGAAGGSGAVRVDASLTKTDGGNYITLGVAGAAADADAVPYTFVADTDLAEASAHWITMTGGEGIDTSGSGAVLTISGEDASNTNKGIASFDPLFFVASSGAISLSPGEGTDPDVAAKGAFGLDTDDHAMRGFDGTNQFVYGQKIKAITVTIASPDGLDEADNLIVWANRSGFDFEIVSIYSMSESDNVDYTLTEMNDFTDFTDTTTIEAITISTDGTGVYYNDLTSGIDHTTIESDHAIAFDNDATDTPDSITFIIRGYFNGDVD